ncbi:MAG: BspA family leucine-rich repeat surface protein [Cyclobacteriaceae bacterium]
MKKLITVLLTSLIVLSCNRNDQEIPEPTDFGYLSMNISVTITEEAASSRVEAVPTDDWKVSIFNADGTEYLVFDPYINAPAEVQLPTGEYYIEAHSNNFQEAAFENPYYFGRSDNFEIDKEELATIDINAELANAKVALNYSPNVTSTFNDYTGAVTVVSTGTTLNYAQGEIREGYFVAEPLSVVVDLSYTKLDGSFITRQFTTNIDAQPKTLYNVNVDATLEDGSITLNVNVDETFDEEIIELGGSPKIFLDENGVTIKAAPDAVVGDTEVINGITYTVVNEQQLRNMVANNEDVTTVCTSLVTDMNTLFATLNNFNQDISSWDVSNVQNMGAMFSGCNTFNQDIGNWDVSNVTNMTAMFNTANSFNQDISNWDVSNVQGMLAMFAIATSFNQYIGNWDVSNVIDMRRMFEGAASFNQDISNWNVSGVTGMSYMFTNAPLFNQDISSWDVSNVTNMGYMFWYATAFNQNLSSWDVTNVTNCSNFKSAKLWTGPTFTNCTP